MWLVEYIYYDKASIVLGIYDTHEKAIERRKQFAEVHQDRIIITFYEVDKDYNGV